ncbi:hypothetical protein [Streptomyces tsukubensis]|uniref:hypothetical protein n=1 Tax=Streptomyces tsukubensis TaxID=83656 RepID=UPI00344CD813
MTDFRETLIRIYGTEHIIRTERTGSVKQLEAAHTRAVKTAITEIRVARIDEEFHTEPTAEEEAAERRRWYAFFTDGHQGPLREWASERVDDMVASALSERWGSVREHVQNLRKQAAPRAVRFTDVPKSARPFPPVKYTNGVPAGLVEVVPGHYATPEAAEVCE